MWPNRITGGTNLPGADLTRVALRKRNNGEDIRRTLSVGDAEHSSRRSTGSLRPIDCSLPCGSNRRTKTYFAAYEYSYEYSTGETVRAFTGRIDANDKVEGTFENAIALLADHPATWTVDSNTITITQKLPAFGLDASPDSPPKLLSVVGSALIGPSERNETQSKLLNTLDATRAFDSK